MPEEFVLGRAPDCDVVVHDPYADRYHARVTIDDQGRATVEDGGTTNGTFVRTPGMLPRRCAPTQPIRPGEEIKIGRTWAFWGGPL